MLRKSLMLTAIAAAFHAAAFIAPVGAQESNGGGLTAFRSERELSAYLREVAGQRRRWMDIEQRERMRKWRGRLSPAACPSSDSQSKVQVTRRWAAKRAQATPRSLVIRGRATDFAGGALAGVSVGIPSLGLGANTTADGRFRLEIPAESTITRSKMTIVARRIGVAAAKLDLDVGVMDSLTATIRLCSTIMELQDAHVLSGVAAYESITNTQHAGVDEGGIVKLRGEHLVILRRGRLFTVSIADRDTRPVSTVDAFGPGLDPSGAWYDELILAGNKVVVVGFSYARGGTELGVFEIDDAARLLYLSTYHLRSNDYYSSRNYASRLIGSKLVFYTPLTLSSDPKTVSENLPSMRKWREGGEREAFQPIASPRRVYRPAVPLNPKVDAALHSVVSCDLANAEMTCEANVVIGPPGRVFYVSPNSVYVWTTGQSRATSPAERNTVYQMPLDGSRPTALGVRGSPVDQFSFLEDGSGNLNVFVRAEARGDGMWRGEVAAGDAALLRVPRSSFGSGRRMAAGSRYRALALMKGYVTHNRFVGDHLLYGLGNGWGAQAVAASALHVVPIGRGPATEIKLPHGVDRIEPMSPGAMVIGADGNDLQFSGIRLTGNPGISKRFIKQDASQGELRSHGFFYKPNGADSGMLGLPIRSAGRPGFEHLTEGSAAIMFLRNQPSSLGAAGSLSARDETVIDDGCKASCVDWYGNARPLFVGDRIFALMGYELVEGSYRDGRMAEVRRSNFAPASRVLAR